MSTDERHKASLAVCEVDYLRAFSQALGEYGRKDHRMVKISDSQLDYEMIF